MGFQVILWGAEKLVPAEYWCPYGTFVFENFTCTSHLFIFQFFGLFCRPRCDHRESRRQAHHRDWLPAVGHRRPDHQRDRRRLWRLQARTPHGPRRGGRQQAVRNKKEELTIEISAEDVSLRSTTCNFQFMACWRYTVTNAACIYVTFQAWILSLWVWRRMHCKFLARSRVIYSHSSDYQAPAKHLTDIHLPAYMHLWLHEDPC